MRPLARVQVDHRDGVPVIAVEGEVDTSNVADVGAALRTAVDNRATGLVVDLTPTSYLDSAGINLLFAVGDDLRARQLKLRLVVAAGSSIARMLAVSSLDRQFPTYPTVAEALAARF